MLHPNHQSQKDAGLVKSLLMSGIGKAYHQQKLSGISDTETLVQWVKATPQAELDTGLGWTIVGDTSRAYDVVMLLARALHILGESTLVIALPRLVKWIEVNADELSRARDCKALFITNFVQVYHECPMTGRQIANTEDFLTNRLDNNQSIFPHVVKWPTDTWWSPTFVHRVSKTNKLFQAR